jgi:quinohemoprotein ethanol dehydrogenase
LLAACAASDRNRFARVDAERLAAAHEEPGEWFTGGRDPGQTYFSPLTQINDTTVQDLGYAWHHDIGATHGMEATPIVVDGILYASGPWGTAFALDAATGTPIWSFDPQVDVQVSRQACCGVVNRGVAVYEGMVFVAALDGRLFALDARTGETRWSVQTIVDPGRAYTVTGAPYVAGDVVVIGNSGAEYDARGYISAYDVGSGRLAWRFFTVPGDPSKPDEHPELAMARETWDANSQWDVGLGGTVWDGMAYDPELDLLYVGTGNGTPHARRIRSPSGGDNLFLASILAIDPATGRLVWHYQTTPAENWDYTAVQKMILADLTIEGRRRRVLLQAPKNGFFYVIDRETGELLSADPYVPVNWASHVDPATGRPVETGQGDYFEEPRLIFPSPAGGHNWRPMAFNPGSGLVYIPAMELGAVYRVPSTPFVHQAKAFNVYTQTFLSDARFWKSADVPADLPSLEQLAVGQPDPSPRGFLRAWDPKGRRIAWQIETSGPWSGVLSAAWNGAGVMTTAGNLVVQGRSTGELYFHRADSGGLLHVIDVGTSIAAAPASYMVNGEQYIVVLAGTGGVGGSHAPGTAAATYGNEGRVVAFRLGGGEVPKRPVREVARDLPEPPVPHIDDPALIAAGGALYERHCSQCHRNTGVGGVPDLRRMGRETHDEFHDIVLEGTRADRGMGSFAALLTPEQVSAIHAYLIDLAWRSHESGSRNP